MLILLAYLFPLQRMWTVFTIVSSVLELVKEPILTYPNSFLLAKNKLLLVEKELLINVNIMKKLLLTRKQTRCLLNVTLISLREVLDITLELELKDTYLTK